VLPLCFSSSGGLVSSVGGSASARWALRNAVFSSLFRFFSSLRAALVQPLSERQRKVWMAAAIFSLSLHPLAKKTSAKKLSQPA
jgi:hypothetical protein